MISIVIPVFNEEKNLHNLLLELQKVSSNFKETYEWLFIDDGSTDSTKQELLHFQKDYKNLKIISFSRNFGQQNAILAGLEYAMGEYIAILDADLQDPPSILYDMKRKLDEGYDVVYGVRTKREGNIALRFFYYIFYRLFNKFTNLNIPNDAGDFCMMKKELAKFISRLPEKRKFIRALRFWAGYKQYGLSYSREKRYAGKSGYSFKKLMGLSFDAFFSFTNIPLRFAIILSIIISFLGILAAISIFVLKLSYPEAFLRGFTLNRLLILSFGSCNLFLFSVMGEYIIRIHEQLKNRPDYIVQNRYGFE